MSQKAPVALVILDGFGHSSEKKYNAITHANTPHITEWLKTKPNTVLQAAGTYVGLPSDYIGNSEVGHITIGAGRIIEQTITTWFNAIDDKSFFTNKALLDAFTLLEEDNKALHIMGLFSDAGVHAHEQQIYATIQAATEQNIKQIFIHAFLDGRDTPAQSALHYLQNLDAILKKFSHVSLGSIHGRFFAMDRDNNWDRTSYSYHVLTEKQLTAFNSAQEAIEHYYSHDITDEFIPPTQLNPKSIIKNGDGIVFCNVRPDRARQLTASFVTPNFNHFETKHLNLAFFITPIPYSANLPTIHLFPQKQILHTLKDQLAAYGKTIFTIAETEKYAHVTYFFRGQNEKKVATETRTMIPSLKEQTYASHPEMSAQKITDAIISSLHTNPKDFYLINYANADMVGHSGNFGATIKAIECLDTQLAQLYDEIVTTMNGILFITADHGKAEKMYDEKQQQSYTAHTTNSVPFIMLQKKIAQDQTLSLQQLSDIAPFILQTMELPVPQEME